MPTSPQIETPGASAVVFRYTLSGYAGQIPAVVLVNSDGTEVGTSSAGADGQPNAIAGQVVYSRNQVWNGTTWDRAPGGTYGALIVQGTLTTAGGATQFRRIATADTNAAVVKASAGRVYGYVISNNTASAKFVKLYNKATAPTVGTDVPVRTIMVPPNGVAAYHVGMGLAGFTAGIAIAATGALADTDTTALAAGDLLIQVDYA